MKIALIKDGLVENVIKADSMDVAMLFPEHLCIDVTGLYVGPGFTWDGNEFTAPVRSEEE